MDDPGRYFLCWPILRLSFLIIYTVKEISDVIIQLTTTPPSVQQATVRKYFTRDAAFIHPFCRTSKWYDSRYQIERIYRWYKILSPKISLKVHSISWDRSNNVLYVGITQVFAIWAFPTHRSEVSLVTVLKVEKVFVAAPAVSSSGDDGQLLIDAVADGKTILVKPIEKWYIKSQNDLYQTDQFMKFAVPQIAWIFPLCQYFATLVCVICSYLFAPVTWWEEHRQMTFQRKETPPKWIDNI